MGCFMHAGAQVAKQQQLTKPGKQQQANSNTAVELGGLISIKAERIGAQLRQRKVAE